MSNNIPEDWKGRAEKAELEADHQRRCAVEWFDKFQASERLTSQLRGEVERLTKALEDTRDLCEIAAGRLMWAATADPGCSQKRGRELVAGWADEIRAALQVKP